MAEKNLRGISAYTQKITKASIEYNRKIEKNYNIKFSKISIEESKVDARDLLLIIPLPASLVAHMARIPSDYAYWATIRAELEDELANINHDYNLWHAEKYGDISSDENTPSKATETHKEALIIAKCEKEYSEFQNDIKAVENGIRKIKVLLKALEYKKDMLQSIGAMIREEVGNSRMTEGAILTSREKRSKSLEDD